MAASIFLGWLRLHGFNLLSMEILEFYTNIPWEMMVSNYVFFVGSSVGLTLVVSLGLCLGCRRYEMIPERGLFVALIAIVCGLTSIGLHLGTRRGGDLRCLDARLSFRYVVNRNALSPPSVLFVAVGYWLLARAELAQEKRGRRKG